MESKEKDSEGTLRERTCSVINAYAQHLDEALENWGRSADGLIVSDDTELRAGQLCTDGCMAFVAKQGEDLYLTTAFMEDDVITFTTHHAVFRKGTPINWDEAERVKNSNPVYYYTAKHLELIRKRAEKLGIPIDGIQQPDDAFMFTRMWDLGKEGISGSLGRYQNVYIPTFMWLEEDGPRNALMPDATFEKNKTLKALVDKYNEAFEEPKNKHTLLN